MSTRDDNGTQHEGDNGHAPIAAPLDRVEALIDEILAQARIGADDASSPDIDQVLGAVQSLAEALRVDAEPVDPIALVEGYFDDSAPQRMDDDTVVVQIQLESGVVSGVAHLRRRERLMVFYTVCPQRIPEARRPAVAMFLTLANYGLPVGNFELDVSDGEVRFKTSLEFGGRGIDPFELDALVLPSVQVMEMYLPGVLAVGFGGRDPHEVVAEIEG